MLRAAPETAGLFTKSLSTSEDESVSISTGTDSNDNQGVGREHMGDWQLPWRPHSATDPANEDQALLVVLQMFGFLISYSQSSSASFQTMLSRFGGNLCLLISITYLTLVNLAK